MNGSAQNQPEAHAANEHARPLTLRLPRAVDQALRAHAERAYPCECCGVLLGVRAADGWRVTDSVATANASAGELRSHYQIAPRDLVKIERAARERGWMIAGFYHSHPGHPAHWSATDLDEAHWIGCSYVITAVENGRAAETRSFALAGASEETKRFVPETIEFLD